MLPKNRNKRKYYQSNFPQSEKPTDLKLEGVSSGNSQVSTPFYSTKAESTSPYGRTANEEEEDTRSVCPSDSDFPPIENPVYQNQLRVLNVLDESFEIDMVPCIMNLCFLKIGIKENTTKVTLLSLKKTVLKGNGKMNQLKKHILFFDFLESHYVSKDEVSKQHLNVIKKSNFVKEDKTTVRSTHPPLETILITTCQKT